MCSVEASTRSPVDSNPSRVISSLILWSTMLFVFKVMYRGFEMRVVVRYTAQREEAAFVLSAVLAVLFSNWKIPSVLPVPKASKIFSSNGFSVHAVDIKSSAHKTWKEFPVFELVEHGFQPSML